MVEHLKDISEHGVHLPANMIGLLPDQISELKLCEPDVQLTEPSQGTQVMPLAESENKPLICQQMFWKYPERKGAFICIHFEQVSKLIPTPSSGEMARDPLRQGATFWKRPPVRHQLKFRERMWQVHMDTKTNVMINSVIFSVLST